MAQKSLLASRASVRRLCCARGNLLRGQSSPESDLCVDCAAQGRISCVAGRRQLCAAWSGIIWYHLCIDCAAQGRISCMAGCCRSHVPHLAAGSVRRLRCARGNLLRGRSSPEPVAWSVCVGWKTLSNVTWCYMRGTSKIVEHLHIQKINTLRGYIYIYIFVYLFIYLFIYLFFIYI